MDMNMTRFGRWLLVIALGGVGMAYPDPLLVAGVVAAMAITVHLLNRAEAERDEALDALEDATAELAALRARSAGGLVASGTITAGTITADAIRTGRLAAPFLSLTQP